MEIVKKTKTHTIWKKRSGRFAVRAADRSWVGGDDKIEILAAAGLLSTAPKKKAPPPEEPPAQAASEEAAGADAETAETESS